MATRYRGNESFVGSPFEVILTKYLKRTSHCGSSNEFLWRIDRSVFASVGEWFVPTLIYMANYSFISS